MILKAINYTTGSLLTDVGSRLTWSWYWEHMWPASSVPWG